MSHPYGRPDPSRYIVRVTADGTPRVFNVYGSIEQARVECARLRALGFDAAVQEGAAGSPDWVHRSIDATRKVRGPVR
jgi:hypothetical protein